MPIPSGDQTVVSLDEFATYLNDPIVLTSGAERATLILSLAQTLCETVVNPLPTGADIVILDVAQRAYANPTSVRNAALGVYSQDQGPFSDGDPGSTGGGLWLSENNRQALRVLSGATGSSAFSVDMTPAGAAQCLPWWDTGVSPGWGV